jgi:hypothetical protein
MRLPRRFAPRNDGGWTIWTEWTASLWDEKMENRELRVESRFEKVNMHYKNRN